MNPLPRLVKLSAALAALKAFMVPPRGLKGETNLPAPCQNFLAPDTESTAFNVVLTALYPSAAASKPLKALAVFLSKLADDTTKLPPNVSGASNIPPISSRIASDMIPAE